MKKSEREVWVSAFLIFVLSILNSQLTRYIANYTPENILEWDLLLLRLFLLGGWAVSFTAFFLYIGVRGLRDASIMKKSSWEEVLFEWGILSASTSLILFIIGSLIVTGNILLVGGGFADILPLRVTGYLIFTSTAIWATGGRLYKAFDGTLKALWDKKTYRGMSKYYKSRKKSDENNEKTLAFKTLLVVALTLAYTLTGFWIMDSLEIAGPSVTGVPPTIMLDGRTRYNIIMRNPSLSYPKNPGDIKLWITLPDTRRVNLEYAKVASGQMTSPLDVKEFSQLGLYTIHFESGHGEAERSFIVM